MTYLLTDKEIDIILHLRNGLNKCKNSKRADLNYRYGFTIINKFEDMGFIETKKYQMQLLCYLTPKGEELRKKLLELKSLLNSSENDKNRNI